MHKAQEALNQHNQESQSSTVCTGTGLMKPGKKKEKKNLTIFVFVQGMFEKLKEAEESHSSLQAECDQYRTVLAETVSNNRLCLVCI